MNATLPVPAGGPPLALPDSPATAAVAIPVDGGVLAAELTLPARPRGLVVFTRGCGCIREAPGMEAVAGRIAASGAATLALALLTPAEARKDLQSGEWSFDLELLTRRLLGVTEWAREEARTRGLSIGYFGTSTFAAAALVAAGELGRGVQAVVARAGRPDFAGDSLPRVTAATLLIVEENNEAMLQLNAAARDRLGGPRRLAIVPPAAHPLTRPEAIDEVGQLAAAWFRAHLGPDGAEGGPAQLDLPLGEAPPGALPSPAGKKGPP